MATVYQTAATGYFTYYTDTTIYNGTAEVFFDSTDTSNVPVSNVISITNTASTYPASAYSMWEAWGKLFPTAKLASNYNHKMSSIAETCDMSFQKYSPISRPKKVVTKPVNVVSCKQKLQQKRKEYKKKIGLRL